jgi:hypothetical protein
LIIADLCNILIRTRATPFTLPPPSLPIPCEDTRSVGERGPSTVSDA